MPPKQTNKLNFLLWNVLLETIKMVSSSDIWQVTTIEMIIKITNFKMFDYCRKKSFMCVWWKLFHLELDCLIWGILCVCVRCENYAHTVCGKWPIFQWLVRKYCWVWMEMCSWQSNNSWMIMAEDMPAKIDGDVGCSACCVYCSLLFLVGFNNFASLARR